MAVKRTTKTIELEIAALQARIAEILDVLPDSEADEAAWLTQDVKEMRAQQNALRDEQGELEKAAALARATKKAKAAAAKLFDLASPSAVREQGRKILASFDRTLDRACAYERGMDARAEVRATIESAYAWTRDVQEARAERAARDARGPIRELSVAEQQYARELRLMRI